MKFLLKTSTVLAFLSPLVALAQTGAVIPVGTASRTTIDSWFTSLGNWVGTLAILLIGVGLVVFFWGIIVYVLAGGDEEKRASGRSLMIYGVIGLFVMVAIWGLVYFLGGILGIGIGGSPALPGVPGCRPGTPGCVGGGLGT